MIVSTGLDAVRPGQFHDADHASGFPYARDVRSGPFVIGKTWWPIPPPSRRLINSIVSWKDFCSSTKVCPMSTVGHACKRRTFCRGSRVLRTPWLRFSPPWMPQLGGPDWWENEAVPVLKDVVTWLCAVAADWGWEPYLTPFLRQAIKEELRDRFREEYERPIDEAAMVWFRDDRGIVPEMCGNCARRGRKAAYKPEMTLDQAKTRCSLALSLV